MTGEKDQASVFFNEEKETTMKTRKKKKKRERGRKGAATERERKRGRSANRATAAAAMAVVTDAEVIDGALAAMVDWRAMDERLKDNREGANFWRQRVVIGAVPAPPPAPGHARRRSQARRLINVYR